MLTFPSPPNKCRHRSIHYALCSVDVCSKLVGTAAEAMGNDGFPAIAASVIILTPFPSVRMMCDADTKDAAAAAHSTEHSANNLNFILFFLLLFLKSQMLPHNAKARLTNNGADGVAVAVAFNFFFFYVSIYRIIKENKK